MKYATIRDIIRAETTRHLVHTAHGAVHLRMWGEPGARPPLVLLHMAPLSSAMWAHFAPLLATDRLVIAPDRLGFGASDHLAERQPLEVYAQATAQALEVAAPSEHWDVLGIHSGSCEAIELARIEPGRVRRVAIVAVPDLTEPERAAFKQTYRAPAAAVDDGSHLTAYWGWWKAVATPAWGPELVHARVLDHLVAGPDVWWAYHAVFDYPLLERMHTVAQRQLVLAPHDDLWAQTERARDRLPEHAEFVELPDLDYEVFTLAAEQMAGHVRRFLDEDG
jgi:pimeloyl-ACP methyl ester carboxylesterase